MNKMISSLAAVLVLSVAQLGVSSKVMAASSDGWTPVAESSTDVYMIKTNSFDFDRANNGDLVEKVIGRSIDKSSDRVSLYQWYVPVADCKAGMGRFNILDMNGNVTGELDYVQNGGDVASEISDVICRVGEKIFVHRAGTDI